MRRSCLMSTSTTLHYVFVLSDKSGSDWIYKAAHKKKHLLPSSERFVLLLLLCAVKTLWLRNSETHQEGTEANRVCSEQWSSHTPRGCEDLLLCRCSSVLAPFPVSLYHVLSLKRHFFRREWSPFK